MDLTALRSHNDRAVLRLVRSGALSRASLAAETGLTPQAISKIVARLMSAGLLEETGAVRDGGRGKPRMSLRLAPGGAYAYGAYVDRDELRVVKLDLTGEVVSASVVPLPPMFTPADVLDALAPLVEAGDEVLGLGIGIAGPLEHRGGVVSPNGLPGWSSVPLKALAEERLGLPVAVDKDTNAGVLAEAWRRPLQDAALVFVGTGLGVGLLLGGEVYRGARSGAGEFGHTTIQLDGPLCVCGRRGCVEAVHAASTGVEAARVLAAAVTNLVQLLDLDQIVLSGRKVLESPDLYLRAMPDVDVSVTSFGPDLVPVGAGLLVLGELF
ncbi:Sugar kinase of the NBD/HSP70 family, may contain an N-terminal HTH domain [Lentzea albidocapillata subsp. violacea]|uniref:Sugar kinase of the NBD/HSP70 family, may contain an N-terminal HTH domain n=1 Tax=Lentzea albidocapillata subsp. violacea TaxID=128104 RepID=A0A1G9PEV9_9PSEU|nr:ROK family transcriptional regulator [Lentzea albidocapillata]SDL97392.1 Sugar kinase of the NBD/HSP70 family, may contain an N-terminal HTH domain [Lentzea albidocapillata subsp. violacea]